MESVDRDEKVGKILNKEEVEVRNEGMRLEGRRKQTGGKVH